MTFSLGDVSNVTLRKVLLTTRTFPVTFTIGILSLSKANIYLPTHTEILIHIAELNIYAKGQREPVWACDYVGYVLTNSIVSEQKIYGFLKKDRGKHLLDCNGDLSRDYSYRDGDFGYQTKFSDGPYSLLQIEEIYLHDTLVERQIAGGHLNQKERVDDI